MVSKKRNIEALRIRTRRTQGERILDEIHYVVVHLLARNPVSCATVHKWECLFGAYSSLKIFIRALSH